MIRSLFFDLDGTLTDPALGITNSILYALNALGEPLPDRSSLYSFIGPPLLDSFQEYLCCSRQEAEEAVRLYRVYFSEQGLFENRVYDGIPEALQELKCQGHRLYLATSKPECFATRIMDRFRLSSFFDGITGSTLDGSLVEKADVLALAMRRANTTAKQDCMMVGDRKHDVIGATRCGILCTGVLYGYGSREELIQAGAIRLAETPVELPMVVDIKNR